MLAQTMMPGVSSPDSVGTSWEAINALCAALDRIVVCLDAESRVVHATTNLDDLLGAGSARAIEGLPLTALLGRSPCGADPRAPIDSGERHARHPVYVHIGGANGQAVWMSIAPAPSEVSVACGKPVTSIVVFERRDAADEVAEQPQVSAGTAYRLAGNSRDDVTRLQQALAANRWRRRATAHALGISRSTLWRRMRDTGLV